MKTKVEIIKETAQYYSEDVSRRAIESGIGCMYKTTDGRKCGVGLRLRDPSLIQDQTYSSKKLFKVYGYDILQEEYRIEDMEFWGKIQCLHDTDINWNKDGLTEEGQKFVDELIAIYTEV